MVPVVCVQFPLFLCLARIGLVAGAKKELNNRVCVCMWVSLCLGGVLLLAALSSLAAPPPSPLTLTTARGGEEWRRE